MPPSMRRRGVADRHRRRRSANRAAALIARRRHPAAGNPDPPSGLTLGRGSTSFPTYPRSGLLGRQSGPAFPTYPRSGPRRAFPTYPRSGPFPHPAPPSGLTRSGPFGPFPPSVGASQRSPRQRAPGAPRLADLPSVGAPGEHGHQYPALQKLIESFAGGARRYTTQELFEHISRRVIKIHGLPEIDGVKVTNGVLDVGRFLYKIGFIHARDESNPAPTFVRFDDRMDLLSTTTNLDDGFTWEIHPSYRSILRITAPKLADA